MISWVKNIYYTLVTIGEFLINLVTSMVKAILWIPSMLGSLLSTMTFMPPFLTIFALVGITLLVIYFICKFG